MKFIKCCICGKLVNGEGHNADPFKKGTCCDECYMRVIVPAKQNQMLKKGSKR